MKETNDAGSKASPSRASEPGPAQAGAKGRSLRPPRYGISLVDSEEFAGAAIVNPKHPPAASAAVHAAAKKGISSVGVADAVADPSGRGESAELRLDHAPSHAGSRASSTVQRKSLVAIDDYEKEDDFVVLANLEHAKSLPGVGVGVADMQAHRVVDDMRDGENLAIVEHGHRGEINDKAHYSAAQIATALADGKMPKTAREIFVLPCWAGANIKDSRNQEKPQTSLVAELAVALGAKGYDVRVEGKKGPALSASAIGELEVEHGAWKPTPMAAERTVDPAKFDQYMDLERKLMDRYNLRWQRNENITLTRARYQKMQAEMGEFTFDELEQHKNQRLDEIPYEEIVADSGLQAWLGELLANETKWASELAPTAQGLDIHTRASAIADLTAGFYRHLITEADSQGFLLPQRTGVLSAYSRPEKRQRHDHVAIKRKERDGVQLDPSGPVQMLDEHHGAAGVQTILPRRQATVGAEGEAEVHAAAERGTSGSSGPLPHLDRIQKSFGRYDLSHVKAHTDRAAAEGAAAMGAQAFASGDHVAFASAPDLHTAAHEATHVVQQRAGVQLEGGVGEVGDVYERNADAVANAVVRAESAEKLLDTMVGTADTGGDIALQSRAIQRLVIIDGNYDTVDQAVMNRENEEGLFADGPGDHTTAHVVLRDWIHNHVAGQPLADVEQVLQDLYDHVLELPGHRGNANMRVGEEEQARVDQADSHAKEMVNGWTEAYNEYLSKRMTADVLADVLDECLQALLNFRNTTPLAATRFGGVGHGEGPARAVVEVAEIECRGAPDFSNDRIERILDACVKLFDIGRLREEMSYDESFEDEDIANFPGTTLDIDQDTDNLIEHHMTTLRQAYPNLWDSYLSEQEQALEDRLRDAFQGDDEYEPMSDSD